MIGVSMTKVLVIGLDGATFDVIKPMIKEGKLPNIAKLMKNGAYGELQSTIPPFTPIAWTSMITGKNAGKHGIMNFRRLTKDHKIEYLNGGSIKEKTIFEIASEAGLKCVVMNVPMTYPPKKINGVWISGMDAPPNSVYTYPKELTEKLNKQGYRVDLDFGLEYSENKRRYLLDLVEMKKSREKAALELLKEGWDMAMVVFVLTDRVQHMFWSSKSNIGEAYEEVDKSVGKLLGACPEANVLLVSDHGAGPIHSGVSLNSYLKKEGYLVFKEYPLIDEIKDWKGNTEVMGDKGAVKITKHAENKGCSVFSKEKELVLKVNLNEKYAYLNIKTNKKKKIRLEVEAKASREGIGLQIGGVKTPILASTFLTRNFKTYNFNISADNIELVLSTYGKMPSGEISIKRVTLKEPPGNSETSSSPVDMAYDVDWNKTRAYSFGYYGSIYINKEIVPKEEQTKLLSELQDKLSKLKNPKNGEKLTSSVYWKKDLFSGSLSDDCPDIVALPTDGYYTVDGFGVIEKGLIFPIPRTMSGAHRLNGILVMGNGPFEKKKVKAEIKDIAPTVLYLLGLPVDPEIDGKVIKEAFKDGHMKDNPIMESRESVSREEGKSDYSEQDSKMIEERLKSLGYID